MKLIMGCMECLIIEKLNDCIDLLDEYDVDDEIKDEMNNEFQNLIDKIKGSVQTPFLFEKKVALFPFLL